MKNIMKLAGAFMLFFAFGMGASLSGFVTDGETGIGIENAHLTIHLIDSTHDNWNWEETFSGADGSYAFDSLSTGFSYVLWTNAEDYDSFFTTFELNEDMTLDIILNEDTSPGNGYVVSGFVNDFETGNGISHAVIRRENANGFWFFQARADENGFYSFQAEGDINIKAMAWGYNEQEMSVSVVEDTTIDFALTTYGYTVTGYIQDAETGEEIPFAVLKKQLDNGNWFYLAWADTTGLYTFNVEGDLNIKALAWGYNSEEMSITVEEDMTLDIALTAINYDGALYGTVTNSETGSPVTGVEVRVFAMSTDSSHHGGHNVYTAETDADGNYLIDNLPSSEVYVRVFENGYEFYYESTTIVDSTLFDIVLTPIPGQGMVSGDVTYDDADGPGFSFIRLVHQDGWGCGFNLWAWTDENGHYEINAPEGDYYVVSIATNDRDGGHHGGNHDHHDSSFFYMEYYDDVQNIEDATIVSIVENEETAGINFSIPFQGDSSMVARVSGIISTDSDTPLNDVALSVYDNEGSLIGTGSTNAFGAFTIEGVDVGATYNLIANADGFDEVSQLFEQEGLITVTNLQLTSPLSVDMENLPSTVSLARNYPNPFNPSTNISFTLETDQNVRLVIYDVLGKKIAELTNNHYSAGTHIVRWNGVNQYGLTVSSGVYIYSLISETGTISQKMLLTK